MLKTLYGQGVHKLERSHKSGIGFPWYDIDDFGIHIGFLVSVRSTPFLGSSWTPRRRSFGLCVREKNGVWKVQPCSSVLLRPQGPKGSRSLLRGCAHLPGDGGPTGLLPKVQESESGKACLAGGQFFPHQAICLLCRPSMSGFGSDGCSERTAPGLEDGEVSAKTINAERAEASGIAWGEGDWHRRCICQERAHLPDCGE